jgi:hypothetical protein
MFVTKTEQNDRDLKCLLRRKVTLGAAIQQFYWKESFVRTCASKAREERTNSGFRNASENSATGELSEKGTKDSIHSLV